MRICFVCSEYPPGRHGGIGTFTQVLGRSLARTGHEVRVVGAYPGADPNPAYGEDRGVRVWRLREPTGRLGWVRARLAIFRLVAEWARNGEIDIVEVPDWMGPAAWWPRLPVPVVTRMNGSASFYAQELGRRMSRTNLLLERSSLRRSDFLSSSSRYTANVTERLFGLPAGGSTVLPNPVELPSDSSRGLESRSVNRVIFTGTLTEKKGVVTLIRAWPMVRAAYPDAELHLFGKDSQTDSGESMKDRLLGMLGDEQRFSVTFHGHVTREELFAELGRAAVAVFPSHSEAFGIAVIESMVLGCPTVFSRRAAGPEVVRDGVDGLLVEPSDPKSIADAVVRILGDGELAQRLGEGGRVRVREEFTVEVQLPRNERFYAACIASFQNGTVRVPEPVLDG